MTNKISSRLFEILTEEDYSIHQAKCIKDWHPIQTYLSNYGDDGTEGECEKEAEISRIICKLYLFIF